MTKKERAAYIQKRLAEIYPDPPIPLDHTDPYTLLIAVLLSAQCTDKRVNQVTPLLFAKARTPKAMAALGVADIQAIIRPCGLSPQKAKAIHQLSQIIESAHGGRVPPSLEELEKLPGVGHKTAQVVMAHAFGVPSFPVDTHIHRLAARWGLSEGKNGKPPSVQKVERDLKALFPQEEWNKLHLRIIYFGREFCTARGCDGTRCEICRALFPRRKPANASKVKSRLTSRTKRIATHKPSKKSSKSTKAKRQSATSTKNRP
jgi:endonuclease-3